MRSNRIAAAAVAVGALLLGWSVVGVSAAADGLPSAPVAPACGTPHPHHQAPVDVDAGT